MTTSPKRIAVINVGGIGDNLLFYPVVRAIKQQWLTAHVSFLLEGRSRAAESVMPDVDKVIPIQVQGRAKWALFLDLLKHLRAGQYDAVVSCGSSPFIAVLLWLSGIQHRIGFKANVLAPWCLTQPALLDKTGYAASMYYALADALFADCGVTPLEPEPSLPGSIQPSEADGAVVKSRLAELGLPQAEKLLILIHPGVSKVSIEKGLIKRWHPSRWAELMVQLSDKTTVLLIGGPDDMGEIEAIRQALPANTSNIIVGDGLTRSLAELAALLSQVSGFVCADSAPMHVAVGVDKPLVALFGEMEPTRLLPDSKRFCWLREAPKTQREHAGYLEIAVTDVAQTVTETFGL